MGGVVTPRSYVGQPRLDAACFMATPQRRGETMPPNQHAIFIRDAYDSPVKSSTTSRFDIAFLCIRFQACKGRVLEATWRFYQTRIVILAQGMHQFVGKSLLDLSIGRVAGDIVHVMRIYAQIV